MKKLKEKVNIDTVIIILILLLPFLDIYKSMVGNYIEIFGISLVEIMNFAYTFILFVIMIYKKKRNKEQIFNWKYVILTGIILATYLIGHLINISYFNEELISNANINFIIEIYHIIKSYILPLIILIVFYKINISPNKIVRILVFMGAFISVIIILTNILKISYLAYGSSYDNEQKIEGNIFEWNTKLRNCDDVNLFTSKGIFYSANQMSAILSSLTLISALFALKENKFIYYIFLLCDCIALIMLSTKTALIAIFASIFIVFAYSLYYYIIEKKIILKSKSIFCSCVIAIVMIGIYMNSPVRYKLSGYISNTSDDRSSVTIAIEDINSNADENNEKDKTDNELKELTEYLEKSSESFGIPKEYIELYPISKNFEFWNELIQRPRAEVSNYRTVKYLIYKNVLEKNNNIWDEVLGIGYTSGFPDLERDILYQNILYGYIGTIIFVIPFIAILVFCIISILMHLKKYLYIENYALLIGSSYIVLASFYTGHIFGKFIPSAILAIMLGSLLSNITKKNIKTNKKKLTFLLLHLGYGGIETATINTANALSDKYEIELISFYKLENNQENLLNNNVTIKYLYNGGPNRNEFKQAVNKKNIINIIKEGFKALDILIKKKILIKREIENSNAFAIVSTRYEFSMLLNKYGRKDVVKIAQEHHHHNNNKKYIKILKKKYKRIDYLFALTESLKRDYKEFLKKNKHTQIVVVPNMITETVSEKSKLGNNNVITISRLHEGKKINELINIFSKIEDKSAKLYIIGSGDEEGKIREQINKLGLNNSIIMTGYLDKNEQKKYLLDSSVYAMTSISEGLPMVLLEAMQFGIPCIAYETDSGVTDIIKHNENGFIIKERNENAYISKLKELLKDSDLRHYLGSNCKKTCEKYSKDNVVKIWDKILTQVSE